MKKNELIFLAILYAIKGVIIANPLALFDPENLFIVYLCVSLPYFSLMYEAFSRKETKKKTVILILLLTAYDFVITFGAAIIIFVLYFPQIDMAAMIGNLQKTIVNNIALSLLYFINVLMWLYGLVLLLKIAKKGHPLGGPVSRE